MVSSGNSTANQHGTASTASTKLIASNSSGGDVPIKVSLPALRRRYAELVARTAHGVQSPRARDARTEAMSAVMDQKPVEANFMFSVEVDVHTEDKIHLAMLEDAAYDHLVTAQRQYCEDRLPTLKAYCTLEFVPPKDPEWLDRLYVRLTPTQALAFGLIDH